MSWALKLAALAGVVALAFGGIFLMKQVDPPVRINDRAPVMGQADEDERLALQACEQAEKWVADNPTAYKKGLEMLEQARKKALGTAHEFRARAAIERVQGIEKKHKKALSDLEMQTYRLVDDGKFIEAAEIYEKYAGPMAEETLPERTAFTTDFRERDRQATLQKTEKEAAGIADRQMNAILDMVVQVLVSGGRVEAARDAVELGLLDKDLAGRRGDLEAVLTLLKGAVDTQRRALQSFEAHRGQNTKVELQRGPLTISVSDIKDGKVYGYTKRIIAGRQADVVVSFGVEDLALRERLTRMGSEEEPDVALAKGVLALANGSVDNARRLFGKTHPLLAGRLVARLGGGRMDTAPAGE